jgi:tetratricopeptide (TPR) repeat protein
MTSSASTIQTGQGGVYNPVSGFGKIRAYDALIKGLTTLASPQVTTNTTWSLVRVTGNANIAADRTVTIPSQRTTIIEATVTFGNTNAKIRIEGTLILTETASLDPENLMVVGDGRIIGDNFISVTVSQLDVQGAAFGSIGRWRSVTFATQSTPYVFQSFNNAQETFRAYQDFKSGTVQKYNNWESFSNVVNHQKFTINPDHDSYIAQFRSIADNITIRAALFDVPEISGGNIHFRDPWYIDYQDPTYGNNWRNRGMEDAIFRTRSVGSNGFKPDNSTVYSGSPYPYRGVFLNQGFSGVNPVYYSVGAPAQQTFNLNGINCSSHFINWTGTNVTYQYPNAQQTAVVFQHANATATALYKGHRISNISQATEGNTGRKIVVDENDIYYVVYVSRGSVWFTKSIDHQGTNWTPDINIGVGKNPSIAITPAGHVRIVWESTLTSPKLVHYRESTNGGTSWQDIQVLAGWPQSADATPIALGMQNVRAIWRGANYLMANIYQNSTGAFISSSIGWAPSAIDPSVGELYGNNFMLAFRQGNNIIVARCHYESGGPYIAGNYIQNLTTVNTNARPTVSTSGYQQVFIAWVNQSTNRIISRMSTNEGNTWATPQEISYGAAQVSHPSLTYAGYYYLLFECGQKVCATYYGNGKWSPVFIIGDGLSPTGPPHFTGNWTDYPKGIWTTGDSAPYRVTVSEIKPTVQNVSGVININTIWSGYYNVIDNIAVSPLATLTILPGTEIYFTSKKSLNVYGKLIANGNSSARIKFTSTGPTSHSSWGSIILNGTSSAGSSITYADILYGTTAVHALNTMDITVRYCNLTQTNRGVHFYNATGSIRDNTITSTSIDHAILLQYSTASIIDNVITKSNRRGAGIMFNSGSSGTVVRNDIFGLDWGIGVIWGSTASTYFSTGMTRRNRIRNCTTGLEVYREGYLTFGTPTSEQFYSYNSVYDNTNNARVGMSYASYPSTLIAFRNWWGASPPDQTKFRIGANATFQAQMHLSFDPWAGIPKIAASEGNQGTMAGAGTFVQSTENEIGVDIQKYQWLFNGIELLNQNKHREAMNVFMSQIEKNPREQAAYVHLYNCYSEDTADELLAFFTSLPREASEDHKLLLGYLYLKRYPDEKGARMAKSVNSRIITENAGRSIAAKAELNNIFITLYNENDYKSAVSLYNQSVSRLATLSEFDHELIRSAIEDYAIFHDMEKPDLRTVEPLPEEFELLQNYPNPFNPTTVIRFAIPEQENVTLRVYDILGRLVTVLADGVYEAGRHEVVFDGGNLASGMYIYTLTTSQTVITKRFLLMK